MKKKSTGKKISKPKPMSTSPKERNETWTGKEESKKPVPEKPVDPEPPAEPPPPPEPPKKAVMKPILDALEDLAAKKFKPEHPWYVNILKPALKVLRDNEAGLEAAGESAVKEFLVLIQGGKTDDARRHFISNLASPEDLIKGMEDSADEIRQASDWDAIVDGLLNGISKVGAGLILSVWNTMTT